jgi:hypothetical protein
MQIRVLVWLNSIIAICLVVFAWNILPLAHGAQCGPSLKCPPLSPWMHASQALAPGLLIAIFTWVGTMLAKRKPVAGRIVLLTCPVLLAAWVALGFVRSLS